MPLVSVIVPVYNVEKYLSRCVESILSQTFTDFELILVNDGSSDNCPKICDAYKNSDNRIIVIHKTNGGLSEARNVGIDIAKGDYITFIDSDDWIDERYLETLYRACINNSADLSSCSYLRTSGETLVNHNELEYSIFTNNEDYYCDSLTGASLPCAKLFKKSIWDELRFPVGRVCEDLFTIYKYVFRCKKIIFSPVQLYYYFLNQESITGIWSIRLLDNLDAIEEQMLFFIGKEYQSALLKACSSYLYNISRHIEQIDLDKDHDYRKEKKLLVKRGRQALIKYKEYMQQIAEWEIYAFKFFPFEMRVRDYYYAMIRRISRK